MSNFYWSYNEGLNPKFKEVSDMTIEEIRGNIEKVTQDNDIRKEEINKLRSRLKYMESQYHEGNQRIKRLENALETLVNEGTV